MDLELRIDLEASSPASEAESHQDNQDFDESANTLWSLYGKEAKNYDKATIKDIKSDMGGLLIFAGLFSAVLTAFIIDRNQTIQPTPAQQSAFLQNQTVVLLSQISHQISSLGVQPSVPSNLSLPSFTLSPSASDVRVNIIWIISLVFSLSAALLATLVQQWARDHMHIFQRYSHPLKISRIRQYLHEGVEKWHMRAMAEVVPGLVHISLFLFLIGLADFLWSTYPIVGKWTFFSIILYITLYIICTFAPVIDPQFPCRTPFSRLAWYIIRKPGTRKCKNQFGLCPKPLSSNMADGQMQLAMENNKARKGRDEKAIQWLVNDLTYDVEVEPLASGIPGSFNATWGLEVWNNDPNIRKDDLYKRIGRLLETCNDRGSFVNDDQWRKRSRACVETVASFVFCMDDDIKEFGNLGKLLSDLGRDEKTCEMSEASSDRSFAIRWTCLSLVETGKMLNCPQIQRHAKGILMKLGTLDIEDNLAPSETVETALRNARRIDDRFAAAWDWVERLRRELKVLGDRDRMGVRIAEKLRQHNDELMPIRDQFQSMERLGVDASILELQKQIDEVTYKLTRQLPGVAFDRFTGLTPVEPEQVFAFFSSFDRPQLICLSQLFLGLCTVSRTRSSLGYQDTIKVLQAIEKIPSSLRSALHQHRLMERQLWRLQDLSVGGAIGFTLELYFLSIKRLLSTFTSPPKEIHKTLFVKTLQAITAGWKKFTDNGTVSQGTLQIILNLVYDIAFQDRGIFSNFGYPPYITDELLDLLGRMIKSLPQPDAYIQNVQREFWPGADDPIDPSLSQPGIVRDYGFCNSAFLAILKHNMSYAASLRVGPEAENVELVDPQSHHSEVPDDPHGVLTPASESLDS